MSSSSHNAAPSALGYLYQSQWPLLELLRRSEERPDSAITIELHDDVAWENQGTPIELLQLKHHPQSRRSLGDKDSDIWRTIRAWMDTQDVADPDGPTLTIVTTQTAASGSAAAALRPSRRDPVAALRLLEAAARESKAEASADNRARFLGLTPAEREIFVGRMYVLDGAPEIGDLDRQVRRVLRWTVPHGHEDTFMGLLWNWWYGKAVDMLQGRRSRVTGVELKVAIDKLRDGFTSGNLPTLVEADEFDPSTESAYLDRCFVQQLAWVGTPTRLIQLAIIDYYRAYTQTVRWVDDDLIGLDELESFEMRLRDQWERAFQWMLADLPVDPDDEAKRRAGQRLLRETLDRTGIRVRERYDESFFWQGKHHELADDGRIGWHPEFSQQLESMLVGVLS